MIRLRPRGQYAPLATVAAALLLAAFVLAPASAAGPELQYAKPADVGMDPAGLKKLNEAMHGMVDGGQLAGVVTMVSRKGKVVHFDAYGKRDVENGLPVEKDTIFRIYSMTKPIVGVALMTYYDEGRFTLDDPVSKFIPEFADLKVAKEDGPDGNPITEDADHPMTMRELMSHTAGLTYGLFSRSQVDTLYTKAGIIDFNQDLEEMIDKLAKIPLRQQPGSMWHYSVAV
ncbi:MAG: beta-lactamase family protein, partial [Holophagales bacterium]|nr:beta-lactamase family protein [Holophagales bacterium]